MDWLIGNNYTGESFKLFGASHLITLAVIVVVLIFVYHWKPNETTRVRFRYGLAILMLVNEAGYQLWVAQSGTWTVQMMLPLHVCSVLVILTPVMLITKNYRIYEYCYFVGIGGALIPLLTPDLPGGQDFPHFRYLTTFISHGAMMVGAIYMTRIEGYRPRWGSLLRVLGIMTAHTIFATGVNLAIGSNYLYTLGKPATASPLDFFPVWPIYIPLAIAIMMVIFVLLYLPFALGDRRAKDKDKGLKPPVL